MGTGEKPGASPLAARQVLVVDTVAALAADTEAAEADTVAAAVVAGTDKLGYAHGEGVL